MTRRYWTTSLCTGSTEIHSWVWLLHTLNNQSSSLDVLSCHLKLTLKVLLILGFAGEVVVSDQAHQAGLCLLVPQHNIKVVIIVNACDFHLGHGADYSWKRWLKHHTLGSICRKKAQTLADTGATLKTHLHYRINETFLFGKTSYKEAGGEKVQSREETYSSWSCCRMKAAFVPWTCFFCKRLTDRKQIRVFCEGVTFNHITVLWQRRNKQPSVTALLYGWSELL